MSDVKKIDADEFKKNFEHAPKIYKTSDEWLSDNTIYTEGIYLIPADLLGCDIIGIKLSDGKSSWCNLPFIFIKQSVLQSSLINNLIKNYKGGMTYEGCIEVYKAYNTLKGMWMPPADGFNECGIDYKYIEIIYTKKECLEALDVIRKFIEEFALDPTESDKDVKPQGYWILCKEIFNENEGAVDAVRCSVCGISQRFHNRRSKECPNCRAIMDLKLY